MFRDQASVRGIQAGFLLALLVLWYFLTREGRVSPFFLPRPEDVWREIAKLVVTQEFWSELATTGKEFVGAFFIAIASGFAVGYLVSKTRFRVKVFDPLLTSLYCVPGIVIYPLYVLFFGLGPESKIAIGATVAFFPVTLSTIAAFSNVNALLLRAAHSMGASNWQMFRLVLVPAGFPVLVNGVRISFIIAFLAIIGCETIAGVAGLGHQIAKNAESMETATMFAYISCVILIAVSLNTVVTWLEARGQIR
jgi:ABC-type nitrate/sulfonate/bicarbonate transport system permease component